MVNTVTISESLARTLDRLEAEALRDLYRHASLPLTAELGLADTTRDGTTMVRAAADVPAFNRVLGLGVEPAASPEQLDAVLRWYGNARVSRFFVQLHPSALPSDLPERLEDLGLRHYNNSVKLYHAGDITPAPVEGIRVEAVGADRASTYAALLCQAAGWPDALRGLLVGAVGKPGWTHYLAYLGDDAVAAASMYRRHRYAWFDFAATLPAHRGRGVQQALLARRIADARAAGARLISADAIRIAPQPGAPSFQNLTQLGFRIAYVRPNYIFETRRDRP